MDVLALLNLFSQSLGAYSECWDTGEMNVRVCEGVYGCMCICMYVYVYKEKQKYQKKQKSKPLGIF